MIIFEITAYLKGQEVIGREQPLSTDLCNAARVIVGVLLLPNQCTCIYCTNLIRLFHPSSLLRSAGPLQTHVDLSVTVTPVLFFHYIYTDAMKHTCECSWMGTTEKLYIQ